MVLWAARAEAREIARFRDENIDACRQRYRPFFDATDGQLEGTLGVRGRRLRLPAAQRTAQSGDGGVDGVIREDPLGLDLIYVQAKRWANVVGRPEIQKFFGALHGRRATKGVFITTSTFSREALEYADGVTPRVILADGAELAQLMIEHSVGVTSARRYDIKRLDLDDFVTEEGEPIPATTPDAAADE